jgi:hypothetical protein
MAKAMGVVELEVFGNSYPDWDDIHQDWEELGGRSIFQRWRHVRLWNFPQDEASDFTLARSAKTCGALDL